MSATKEQLTPTLRRPPSNVTFLGPASSAAGIDIPQRVEIVPESVRCDKQLPSSGPIPTYHSIFKGDVNTWRL